MTKKINFHVQILNESSETSHLRLLKHTHFLVKTVLFKPKFLQIVIMGTVCKSRKNLTDLIFI